MMKKNTIEAFRVFGGIIALVLSWTIGGFFGAVIFPHSPLINRMETVSAKIGASIGILVISFLLSRYLLQSIRQIIVCYMCVEIFAFAIILFLTGLSSLTWFDLRSNISWLYAMTWNVTVVYIIGSALGLRLRNR